MISSTVHSGTLAGSINLLHTPIPVITWESYLMDDFKMTGHEAGWEYGSIGGQKFAEMGNSNHPLSAGYDGTIQVYQSTGNMRWGKPTPFAIRTARIPHTDKYLIFGYDTGAPMIGGFPAPAKRIGFFLDNHSFTSLTSKGLDLFRSAAIYATGCQGGGNNFAAAADYLQLGATQRETQVGLDWTSNLGFVTTHYEVERSADGTDWEVILERTNERATDVLHRYRDVDTDPMIGINYYRVRAYFYNGTSRLTDARKVVFNDLTDFGIFPNPADAEVRINLASAAGTTVTIQCYDALGRLVQTENVGTATATPYRIGTADWKAGAYYLLIRADDRRPVGQKVYIVRE